MSRRDGNQHTIESVISKVNHVSSDIKKISDSLVKEYCTDLDTIMENISKSITDLTDDKLEMYILDLANILYFTGVAQEDLGIKEDTCRAIRTELYNKARDSAIGTVTDKNTYAEITVQQETVVLAIYNRAYRKVKLRMDAGYEMLASMKKIMNKRISEAELSNSRYIGGTRDVY